MQKLIVGLNAMLLGLILAWPDLVGAQESFHKAKSVRIIVGLAAGGGYDLYARTLVAEAKKANLDINPDDGASLENNLKEIFKLEPAQVNKLKEFLK